MPRIPELKITGKNVGAYPATWARWDAAALACHKTRQDWIRDALNEAASKVEAKAAKRPVTALERIQAHPGGKS